MRLAAARSAVLTATVAALAAPARPRRCRPPALAPAGPPVGRGSRCRTGVVVLVAERPGIPIVIVRASVEAGAVLDPPDKAGVANLTALLLTRGSATRTALEIDRAVEFVGGSLEGEGGRDASELKLSVLRKDLALGLDLLADALLRPTFPDAEFERNREEVQASVQRSEEDPGTVAARVLRRLVFPEHPYGRPVEGTEASLRAITRGDVVAFHRDAYRPERTIVAVAGDITAAEVRAELEARLGGWSVATPAPATPGAAALGLPSRTETIDRALTQATILLGQATVTRGHPDFYPLLVASQILGGGIVVPPVHARPRGARPRLQRLCSVRAGPPTRALPRRAPERERPDPRGAGGGAGGADPPPPRACVGRGAGSGPLLSGRQLPPADGHGGGRVGPPGRRSSDSTSASTTRRASAAPCRRSPPRTCCGRSGATGIRTP